jgi:hypothetical protein
MKLLQPGISLLRCMSPFMALSGRSVRRTISAAIGGKADSTRVFRGRLVLVIEPDRVQQFVHHDLPPLVRMEAQDALQEHGRAILHLRMMGGSADIGGTAAVLEARPDIAAAASLGAGAVLRARAEIEAEVDAFPVQQFAGRAYLTTVARLIQILPSAGRR